MRLIKAGEHIEQINQDKDCNIPKVVPLKTCVTIGEATQECERIEYLYTRQTD
jgi:hypothetical protein